MLVTHRQCMTPVAAGNTNPVTLISYSFVCLGLKWARLIKLLYPFTLSPPRLFLKTILYLLTKQNHIILLTYRLSEKVILDLWIIPSYIVFFMLSKNFLGVRVFHCLFLEGSLPKVFSSNKLKILDINIHRLYLHFLINGCEACYARQSYLKLSSYVKR